MHFNYDKSAMTYICHREGAKMPAKNDYNQKFGYNQKLDLGAQFSHRFSI